MTDEVAKEAYAKDERSQASLIPRTALLAIAKRFKKRDYNRYLESQVKASAEKLAPPRDIFKRPTPIYASGGRRRQR